MANDFDYHELTELANRMIKLYTKQAPKETKNFLQREGNTLKKQLRANTVERIENNVTGNLSKASNYSRSKAQKKGDAFQVRVKNKAPHAWLFEHGHEKYIYDRSVGHAVRKTPKVKGRHPAADTYKGFLGTFYRDAENWVDDMLEKNL